MAFDFFKNPVAFIKTTGLNLEHQKIKQGRFCPDFQRLFHRLQAQAHVRQASLRIVEKTSPTAAKSIQNVIYILDLFRN